MVAENIERLKEIYGKEISHFQEIGHQFVSGKITSGEFKGASGGMGVYAQRGGERFMIRLRILSGVMPLKTLELIRDFCNGYSLPSIHLTTRQAVQLHNLAFDDVIGIMSKSLDHNLFTRGGGGNYPRNVSLSPLSGVEEEGFDVTPYAIMVNEYFVSRMSSYKLPRKFKVAFSNNSKDTANATIADLGFLAVHRDGKEYFQIYLGGSLGANGDIALPYDTLAEPKDILYHVEAALRLFVEEGDFENKAKARMRFIVKRMGEEQFLSAYKKVLEKIKESEFLEAECKKDSQLKLEKLPYERLEGRNIIAQKQEGYFTFVVHPQGGILDTRILNDIVLYLKKIPQAQVRLSMEESMYIRNLTAGQVEHLLDITKEINQTTRLRQSICCIGVPTCQIGIQNSQKLLDEIISYFEDQNFKEDILPSLHISGCVNSCSRHQVNQIGFQGKKKRVEDVAVDAYSLYIGGKVREGQTCLAKNYGDLPADRIPAFLYELALELKSRGLEFSEYLLHHEEQLTEILAKYVI